LFGCSPITIFVFQKTKLIQKFAATNKRLIFKTKYRKITGTFGRICKEANDKNAKYGTLGPSFVYDVGEKPTNKRLVL
jgi:hypothetical protein